MRGDERLHELMSVFADAAPLPQRGAVVDQYAHGGTLPYRVQGSAARTLVYVFHNQYLVVT